MNQYSSIINYLELDNIPITQQMLSVLEEKHFKSIQNKSTVFQPSKQENYFLFHIKQLKDVFQDVLITELLDRKNDWVRIKPSEYKNTSNNDKIWFSSSTNLFTLRRDNNTVSGKGIIQLNNILNHNYSFTESGIYLNSLNELCDLFDIKNKNNLNKIKTLQKVDTSLANSMQTIRIVDEDEHSRDSNVIQDACNYLINERYISEHLLKKLYDENVFFVNPNYECVFISDSGGEKRATPNSPDPTFKGTLKNSNTNESAFTVIAMENADQNVIAITEAAIDAISLQQILPFAHVCSTNGAGRFNLQYKIAMECLVNRYSLMLAFDNDEAGKSAGVNLQNALVVRHTPLLKKIYNEPLTNENWSYYQNKFDMELLSGKISFVVKSEDAASIKQCENPQINGNAQNQALNENLVINLKHHGKNISLNISTCDYYETLKKMKVFNMTSVLEENKVKDWNELLKKLNFQEEYNIRYNKEFTHGDFSKFKGPNNASVRKVYQYFTPHALENNINFNQQDYKIISNRGI